MDAARLITIPLSHYCEKARWMLDVSGLRYVEEPHAPVAHLRATRAVGGRSVPVLVYAGGVLYDSTDIARHAESVAAPDRRLMPEEPEARARVLALEEEFDETLGNDARLLAYWYNLHEPALARALVGRMMRLRSPVARHIVAPLFRQLIFRKYGVDSVSARAAEARVRATFAHVSELLLGRRYLVAGRFTLADLTFAALATPLLAPPEHPVIKKGSFTPPPDLAAFRDELAKTRAGQHVFSVYREHRAPASPS